MAPLRAAVLTVSDSVAAGTRIDRSGPAVRDRLAGLLWEVALEAVADEREQIAERLRAWSDSGQVDVIFTTGGTGIAARDVTPEATRSVIDREVPGIGEWTRARGHDSTPTAILSRGLAGTRKRCLIVNLPGSPTGALESLDVIIDVVGHAVDLLCGKTEHTDSGKRLGPASRHTSE